MSALPLWYHIGMSLGLTFILVCGIVLYGRAKKYLPKNSFDEVER